MTRAATGVSGISEFSPTLSIARGTGTLVFSVFEEGGMMIATMSQAEAAGERLANFNAIPATAAILPGGATGGGNAVSSYLADYSRGLPPEADLTPRSYRSSLETGVYRAAVPRGHHGWAVRHHGAGRCIGVSSPTFLATTSSASLSGVGVPARHRRPGASTSTPSAGGRGA